VSFGASRFVSDNQTSYLDFDYSLLRTKRSGVESLRARHFPNKQGVFKKYQSGTLPKILQLSENSKISGLSEKFFGRAPVRAGDWRAKDRGGISPAP